MFEVQWPLLLLLLPLPLAIYWLPTKKQEDTALRVPFFQQVQTLQTAHAHRRGRANARTLVLWLIWASCLLAAANPRWIGEPISLPNSGRDLLIAVDISESMLTKDMKWQGNEINRLDAIKVVVGDFVQNRKSDRLGLILFATQAYLQAPLTYDRETVHTLLNEAQIYFAGKSTSIGDAIGLATKRLRARPDAQRVLILLSDGANTSGELNPLQAADLAQQEHVKIYTIGFGADEMVVQDGFFGARRVNPSADLDEPTMRAIADKTGGQYFRARNLEELGEIHRELNRLEPIESDQETFRPVQDLFYWPLAIALLLSFGWALRHLLAHNKSAATAPEARQ